MYPKKKKKMFDFQTRIGVRQKTVDREKIYWRFLVFF
jgi:hypothetical protein